MPRTLRKNNCFNIFYYTHVINYNINTLSVTFYYVMFGLQKTEGNIKIFQFWKRCWSKDTKLQLYRMDKSKGLMYLVAIVNNTVLNIENLLKE